MTIGGKYAPTQLHLLRLLSSSRYFFLCCDITLQSKCKNCCVDPLMLEYVQPRVTMLKPGYDADGPQGQGCFVPLSESSHLGVPIMLLTSKDENCPDRNKWGGMLDLTEERLLISVRLTACN